MTIDPDPGNARDVAVCIHPSFRWLRGLETRPRGATSQGISLCAAMAAAAMCMHAAPASALDLANYPALVHALVSGQSVMTLLDLQLCTREGTDVPGPRILGGSRITRFLIPNGQYVAFADTHQTLSAEDRPVTEYIRYRAMPDGNVTVRFATVAAASDQVIPRGQYHCQFMHGVRFIEGQAPSALPLRTRIDPALQAPIDNGHDDAQQAADRGNPD